MLPINLTILYFIILFITLFISKKLDFYDKPNIRKVHNSRYLTLVELLLSILSNNS